MKSILRYAILSAVLPLAVSAHAFDIGAEYSFNLNQSVRYDTNIGGWTGNHETNTAVIHGNRSTGVDGGTTTLLPFATYEYDTYCIEIGQNIGGGYNTHAVVAPLLGSVTNSGGNSGPVTFDATRTANLQLLWGSFKSSVVDADTSAAFQLAQWEISFDDDVTLDQNANSRFWSTETTAYRTTAESWLTAIRTGSATTQQNLLILSDPDRQDLVTPVPEPASMLALAAGAAIFGARRRKRA